MQTTTNFGLKKPEGTDYINVNDLNENADKIDTELKSHADSLAEVSTHLAEIPSDIDSAIEQKSYKKYMSNKDSEGIFTTVEYKRKADNTLAVKSVLSGGTSPQYSTRTITYYATNGTTVAKTETFTLSYDADGDLISEV